MRTLKPVIINSGQQRQKAQIQAAPTTVIRVRIVFR